MQEEFEDTKGLIRRVLFKDKQNNGQKKKYKNTITGRQNTTKKIDYAI